MLVLSQITYAFLLYQSILTIFSVEKSLFSVKNNDVRYFVSNGNITMCLCFLCIYVHLRMETEYEVAVSEVRIVL